MYEFDSNPDVTWKEGWTSCWLNYLQIPNQTENWDKELYAVEQTMLCW